MKKMASPPAFLFASVLAGTAMGSNSATEFSVLVPDGQTVAPVSASPRPQGGARPQAPRPCHEHPLLPKCLEVGAGLLEETYNGLIRPPAFTGSLGVSGERRPGPEKLEPLAGFQYTVANPPHAPGSCSATRLAGGEGAVMTAAHCFDSVLKSGAQSPATVEFSARQCSEDQESEKVAKATLYFRPEGVRARPFKPENDLVVLFVDPRTCPGLAKAKPVPLCPKGKVEGPARLQVESFRVGARVTVGSAHEPQDNPRLFRGHVVPIAEKNPLSRKRSATTLGLGASDSGALALLETKGRACAIGTFAGALGEQLVNVTPYVGLSTDIDFARQVLQQRPRRSTTAPLGIQKVSVRSHGVF